MIQVQVERVPYTRHSYYKGSYNYNNQEFDFVIHEVESNNILNFHLAFSLESNLLPFNYEEAKFRIFEIFSPKNGNQKAKD